MDQDFESTIQTNQNSNRRKMEIRRVSFPETQLVTGYFEPEDPLRLAEDVTTDQIKAAYINCCEKYSQQPLERVIEQINNMALDNARETYFELKDEIITAEMCETFEEIFRRVQFLELTLNGCSIGDDAAAALFDMVEYYESAIRLKINISFGIQTRGWNAFKRYLTKSQNLSYVEIYSMKFKEKEFNIAISWLISNSHIETFKLRNCYFENSITAMVNLAQKLGQNSTLRELYLPNNDLKSKDIKLLCSFLKSNNSLYYLDLSNNDIQNVGALHVFNALIEKNVNERALSVLVLWNNNIDDEVYSAVNVFLESNYKLEVLNLGHNALKDMFVLYIEHDLAVNASLQRLGMQKCQLTDVAILAMCRVVKDNKTLERIDFRGNKVTLDGLNAFHKVMQECTSIIQVDFDLTPSNQYNVPVYAQIYMKLSQICETNKQLKQNDKTKMSRKISLTCQTLQRHPVCAAAPKTSSGRLRSPQLSPVPSPSTSPKPTKTKSRFSITPVNEPKPIVQKSRFTVCNVQEPVKKTIGFDCEASTSSNGFDGPSTSGISTNGFKPSQEEIEDVVFGSAWEEQETAEEEASDMDISDVSSDGKGSDQSMPDDDLVNNDKPTSICKENINPDEDPTASPKPMIVAHESPIKQDTFKSALDECRQSETDSSSSSDDAGYIGIGADDKPTNVIDKNVCDANETKHDEKNILKELTNQVIDLKNNNNNNNNQFESK